MEGGAEEGMEEGYNEVMDNSGSGGGAVVYLSHQGDERVSHFGLGERHFHLFL